MVVCKNLHPVSANGRLKMLWLVDALPPSRRSSRSGRLVPREQMANFARHVAVGTARRARKLRASTIQGTEHLIPHLRNMKAFLRERGTQQIKHDNAVDEAGVAECPSRK